MNVPLPQSKHMLTLPQIDALGYAQILTSPIILPNLALGRVLTTLGQI